MNALQKIVAPATDSARIVDRVNMLAEPDLSRAPGWNKIRALSAETVFDGIDADPTSVVVDQDGGFEVQAYIYFVISDPATNEKMGEEYAATVTGLITAEQVRIGKVEVDTTALEF